MGIATMKLEIMSNFVTLDTWKNVYRHGASVRLSKDLFDNVDQSSALVSRILRKGRPVYGVNTGFGKLSSVQIEDAELERLQRNLVLSHTVGVGDPIPEPIVRLIMAMKITSFGHGASGVRRELVETLQDMLSHGVLPVIPAQGSVGASGDLAPLAHLAACMIGCGHAMFEGEQLPGSEALQRAGITPLTLGPKEGLALLNGTQVSTAFALSALLNEAADAAEKQFKFMYTPVIAQFRAFINKGVYREQNRNKTI